MSTEWKFAFLNTVVIIFCLVYSLNIPHSNQNPSFFSWFLSSLTTFRRMARSSHENNFDISFRVILLLPRETELCLLLMTNTKYIVCLSFPGPQAKLSGWMTWPFLNALEFFPIKKENYPIFVFVQSLFSAKKSPKVVNLPLTDEKLSFWRHKQAKWLL